MNSFSHEDNRVAREAKHIKYSMQSICFQTDTYKLFL